MMKIANLIKRARKNDKGFTLIELMVVIAVLGILAALVIPQFTGVTDKAKQATAESTASSVASAAAMYYAENGGEPSVSDLDEYLSNLDKIEDDYKITFEGDEVKVELIEDSSVFAKAYYK